jgi:SAM-dependent methyltransferase
MAMINDTTEFNADQYANIYPAGIEHYYWHRARNRIVTRKLRAHLSADDAVLDLGCGAGVLVAHLRAAGFDCEGADIGHPTTVAPGTEGHLYLGQDAFLLPAAYRDRISTVLLMDVLEHLPDPSEFLERCDEYFPNVRWVFVTVPARMEIWSNYDEYNGHYRRYTLESFRSVATPGGFALEETGYFFHALYWAVRIHKILVRKRATTFQSPRMPLLHDLVGRFFDWEERGLPTTSRGASLYALYSRRRRPQN